MNSAKILVLTITVSLLAFSSVYSAEGGAASETAPPAGMPSAESTQTEVPVQAIEAAPVIQPSNKDLYEKALDLQTDGMHEGAAGILEKLSAAEPENQDYRIGYLDALLDQTRSLKAAGNAEWELTAKKVGREIKTLFRNRGYLTDSDYWVLYAKYSWVVEATRGSHLANALRKAFYYEPGNPKAHVLSGDVSFDSANRATFQRPRTSDDASGDLGAVLGPAEWGKKAKSSYESALSTGLDPKTKACIFLKLGDLEDQIFKNRESARADWEKSVAASPESSAGKKARDRLAFESPKDM